ncbi:MAG: GNAT family N-acetyltransferase [Alphaproteobacteria bacterium]|nr:GNAT family N-acetyltransferase [Alphaproteobacteria bacterium]
MDTEAEISPKRLFDQTILQLEEFKELAAENRAKIICDYRHGGTDQQALQRFLLSLTPVFFNQEWAPGFEEVYEVYFRNFPIEKERESLAGFRLAASFNANRTMQGRYGPFEEAWGYVRDPGTGKVIGGINFTTFSFLKDAAARPYAAGTQHLMYLFVSPEYRRLGVGNKLVGAAETYSKKFVARVEGLSPDLDGTRLFTLNEQNQPFKMTPFEYLYDTMNAGVDQFDRLLWWQKSGFRPLLFPYVAPPLEEGGEACALFDLNINNGQFTAIPGSLIKAHLYRFISVKLLKNTPAETDQNWREQESLLDAVQIVKARASGALRQRKEQVWNLLTGLAQTDAKWPEGLIGELLERNPAPSGPYGANNRLRPPELRH